MITRQDIQDVARQIAERFQPRQVILFGSYAYGHPTPDSDVDYLVVMETEEPPLHAAARIAASMDHPFPLDILVYTPMALQAALDRQSTFAQEVADKGIILYEAGDDGVDGKSRRRLESRAA